MEKYLLFLYKKRVFEGCGREPLPRQYYSDFTYKTRRRSREEYLFAAQMMIILSLAIPPPMVSFSTKEKRSGGHLL
jgi:hypothetical protein